MQQARTPLSIAIVGAGVVGGATGAGLAAVGHDVSYYDSDAGRVAELRSAGRSASPVSQLVDARPDLYLVSVPTPTRNGRCDLSRVEGASRIIARCLRDRDDWSCVVLRSTMPPGSTEDVIRPLLEERSGKVAGVDFGVVFNPEFLREASAPDDFLHPRVIVVGAAEDRSHGAMAALYAPWNDVPMRVMPIRAAETAKYVANTFNAAKISYFNELHRVLSVLEVESTVVIGAATEGAEGLWNPAYGTRGGAPFGGACLPKDLDAFVGMAEDLDIPVPLLRAVREVNEALSGGRVSRRRAPERAREP